MKRAICLLLILVILCSLSFAASSFAAGGTSDTIKSLIDMVWNGARFVAVGTDGVIVSSVDGKKWTSVSGITTKNLCGISWNGKIFIAVGAAGTVLISTDGTKWKQADSGTNSQLCSIIWNKSQFVCVGEKGAIITSKDGEKWNTRKSGTNEWLNKIVWNGKKFIAAGDNGVMVSSADGVDWAKVDSGTKNYLFGITWNGKIFPAAGGFVNTASIMTSSDGTKWSNENVNTTSAFKDILWNGKIFVAVGSNGVIESSVDGHTWTDRNSGSSSRLSKVSWNGKIFLAAGEGGIIIESADGIQWSYCTNVQANASIPAATQPPVQKEKWDIITLDNNKDAGRFTSMAVDNKGKIYISYLRNGSVYYVTNSSGKWAISRTVVEKASMSNTAIAVDSKGKVYISYCYNDGVSSGIAITTNSAGKWTSQHIAPSSTVSSIAIDSKDIVHLVCNDMHHGYLLYTNNAAGSFPDLPVSCPQPGFSGIDAIMTASIAIGADDSIYIAGCSSDGIKGCVKSKDGKQWTSVGHALIGSYLQYSNSLISVDSKGILHWADEDIRGDSSKMMPAIFIGKDDKVHVSYFNNGTQDLLYFDPDKKKILYSGTQLDTQGCVGEYSSIAADNLNNIYISLITTGRMVV